MTSRLALRCGMVLVAFVCFVERGFADGFVYPIDVAAAPDGSVYVVDLKLPGVWKFADGELSVFHQASKKFRTPLNSARCIAVDEKGIVYVGDSATREIYRFDANGTPKPLTNGEIGIPIELVVRGENLVVSDLETQRLWTVPRTGGEPEELAVIAGVRGLTVGKEDALYLLSSIEDPIRQVMEGGKITPLLKGTPFRLSQQLTMLGGSFYLTDNYGKTVWKYDPKAEGEPVAFVKGEPLVSPVGITTYKKDLLVADPHAKAIFRITVDGKVTQFLPPPKERDAAE